MLLPLLITVALFFSSLLIYGMAMHFVVRVVVKLIRSGDDNLGFWAGTAFMIVVTRIILAGHLTQIVLWAAAFRLGGQIPSLATAFYYSAQAYTALGDGEVQLSEPWRMLGPLEAINGLLFFGMSTAVLFAIMRHLIDNHLSIETGKQGEASESLSPVLVARFEAASQALVPVLPGGAGHSMPEEQTAMGLGSSVTLVDSQGALG